MRSITFLIILSLLIRAIHASVGRQNIYEDDKKLVDKYHLIRKEKEKCKSSTSKCKTEIPVDKDEGLIIVDHIISSNGNSNQCITDTYQLLQHFDQDNSWRDYLSEIYMIDVDDDVNVDLRSNS